MTGQTFFHFIAPEAFELSLAIDLQLRIGHSDYFAGKLFAIFSLHSQILRHRRMAQDVPGLTRAPACCALTPWSVRIAIQHTQKAATFI
jgi:hypothetical protein